MRTNMKGDLLITARGIAVYSAKGEPLGVIAMPENPRNCAFGDKDFRTLYITGQKSLFRVRLETPANSVLTCGHRGPSPNSYTAV